MLTHLRPAVILLALMTAITGLAYPLAMTGVAQVIAPTAANGSLVIVKGQAVGSRLIGQLWTSDKYFHGRPSAAGNGYDALASGGSNLGATSQKLKDRVMADVVMLKKELGQTAIPADAVTASGSGLDPDISPEFALAQVPRVAKARNLDDGQVRALVGASIRRPIGVFGEPHVNVLLLNLSLDGLSSAGNG